MPNTKDTDKSSELAREIRRNRTTGEAAHAVLSVDDRVMARVTDGIYRTPSSAFRELISNAYDADATSVVVQTDAPRFERIIIRDNGNGMTPEALADLVHHIGGSPKRTTKGMELAVVSKSDPELSPGGRRLIGKIGIGLFSVSQLTQHFQIITKRRGDNFRTSADIVLRTYTEQLLGQSRTKRPHFETGEVLITSEGTSDINSHGTEIILMDLRQQTKEMLRSMDRWQAVTESLGTKSKPGQAIEPPRYHIGRVKKGDPDTYEVEPHLPWKSQDPAREKFAKLYNAVGNEVKVSRSNPNLQSALDYYLGMLWTLSLAVPVRYIKTSPFQLTGAADIDFYLLSNQSKGGQPEPVRLGKDENLAKHLSLSTSESDPVGRFQVFVDDVELLRPINFDEVLHARSSIARPLLFVGRCKSGLEHVPATRGGGELEFEAYFYWNSKIIPKENIGVLVRINNASGTLFDKSFMNYQVSELTRLRQLTAEIFVSKGLDAALNIDRESFNFSHPHYQFLMRWLHLAVRQVTNKLKTLGKEVLDEIRGEHASKLEQDVLQIWNSRRDAGSDSPPEVVFVSDDPSREAKEREKGVYVFRPAEVFAKISKANGREGKVRALVTVLDAYGLIDDLSYAEQEALIRDIITIFLS